MKQNFKEYFMPSRDFAKKTKERFLATFDVRYPSAQSAWSWSHVFKIGAAGLVVVMVLFGGASVYADTTNVPVNNILYPLKRLSENVQLAVAPVSAQAQLQATFAERRVDEIKQVQAQNPTSTVIASLTASADNDANASMNSAINTNLSDGKLTILCGKLFSAIATSSLTLNAEIENHARDLARFEDRCDAAMVTTSTTATATSSATFTIGTASSTSSSTTNGSSSRGRGNGKFGGRPTTRTQQIGITTNFSASSTVGTTSTVSPTSSFGVDLEMRLRAFLTRSGSDSGSNDNGSNTTSTTNGSNNSGKGKGNTNGSGIINFHMPFGGGPGPAKAPSTTVSSTLNLDL